MVVEDEGIVALHLRRMLTNLGFNVVATAASGREALASIQQHQPELVLMDIRLEGDIDGIETVRRFPRIADTSVIFLTAHSEPATIERAKLTAPHGYLLKPVSEQDLFITVSMVMERRRAEHALRETEEHLRLAMDSGSLGSWDLDLSSRALACRGRADTIFGLPESGQETPWGTLVERLHPDDRELVANAFGDEGATDSVREAEFRIGETGAGERWIHMWGRPFRSPLGSRHMIGIVQDVTEKRRRETELQSEIAQRQGTEQALRQSEEAFRELFLSTPVPLWVADIENFRFLAVNDAAISSFGYSREELIGLKAVDLIVDFDPSVTRRQVRNKPFNLQFPNQDMRRKDGTIIQADLFVRSFKFEGCTAGLAAAVDVTERNVIEARLRHAQKMEALGQLTGGLAHDFNNILSIVLGNLELINEDQALAAPIRDMVADALAATARGASLTNHLLAVSRQQLLIPKVIDIRHLIGATASLLPRVLEESIKIHVAFAAELGKVRVDPGQLENALLNLALNARDAMPAGGKLVIEAENTSLDESYAASFGDVTAGSYVMLAVTDTGTGMSAEVLNRVFDPFFTTKPAGRGTGLGLSMVCGFVKQSGGHMRIYSELGHGTTIKIFLPTINDEAETPPAVLAEPKIPRAKSGEVVLVIEDEPSIKKLIKRFLTDLGYRVLEAAEGLTGLELLAEAERCDLLITDVMLPRGLNGPIVAREAVQKRPALAVVFITGYAPQGVMKSEELEGARVLSKPFSRVQLSQCVRQAIDEAQEPVARRRLLVVDDEPSFGNYVARVALEMDFDVEVTENARAFKESFARLRPDVILLDVLMPVQDGIELIQWLAASQAKCRIIVITGGAAIYARMAKEIAANRGLFDLTTLVKPLSPNELRTALE